MKRPNEDPDRRPGPNGQQSAVPENLPQEIQDWVQNSRRIFAGQARDHGDRTYLLVTWGEKPTGGYETRIASLDVEGGELVAICHFKEPSKGEGVTQERTYPYDLVSVPRIRVPVSFRTEGNGPQYIMRVIGTEMEPIVRETEWIKVFEPHPGQEVRDTLRLRGICSVFEGTVNFKLKRDGTDLHEGFAMGAMGDWGYFETSVPLHSFEAGPVNLEVFTYSPKDGSIRDLITIPLTIVAPNPR